jgi:hypothetical protein
MPKYPAFQMTEFRRLLVQANPTVESGLAAKAFGKSSLQPLMEILNSDKGTADQVRAQLQLLAGTRDGVYGSKANKYKQALYYLELTYPIAIGQRVGVGADKARAVILHKSGRQPSVKTWRKYVKDDARSWAPEAKDGMELATATRIEGVPGTVEEFILNEPAQTGVIMIHLQGFQDSMNRVYDGWKALDHMRSVLRVAAAVKLRLLVLKVAQGDAVCAELKPALAGFGEVREVYVARHSGFHDASYREFVGGLRNVVVMGFDADVCVHINVFGGPELLDATDEERRTNAPSRPVGALLSEVNVITSRPLLVARGFNGVVDRAEYGPQIERT